MTRTNKCNNQMHYFINKYTVTCFVWVYVATDASKKWHIHLDLYESFPATFWKFNLRSQFYRLDVWYRISSNKHWASNKYRTFGYPHWNKRLPRLSCKQFDVVPLNAVLITD